MQVWKCEVDIAAVGRTCTDWPLLLGFLQRRQPSQHPTCDIKPLLPTIVKVVLSHSWLDPCCAPLASPLSGLIAVIKVVWLADALVLVLVLVPQLCAEPSALTLFCDFGLGGQCWCWLLAAFSLVTPC